ncbi:MAG: hypothetical protein JW997_06975, partial [Actinobacteria bacterium]|nr:hypothetical protein [Actinomycetota bacterium]
MAKIKKILLIAFASLAVFEAVCFFVFAKNQFYSILASGLLTFVFFAATLFLYYIAAKSVQRSRTFYVYMVFFVKLVLSALSFYIVYRSASLSMLAYAVSFLIFF